MVATGMAARFTGRCRRTRRATGRRSLVATKKGIGATISPWPPLVGRCSGSGSTRTSRRLPRRSRKWSGAGRLSDRGELLAIRRQAQVGDDLEGDGLGELGWHRVADLPVARALAPAEIPFG